jgi:hypothetical protein
VSSSTIGVLLLLRLSYLLFEPLDLAILLRFHFIAPDDLDDFLDLRQCWLRDVWRCTALLRLTKGRHRDESGEGEDKFEFHERVPDYAGALW